MNTRRTAGSHGNTRTLVLIRCFKLDCSGEQDVVLEVDVLVKVLFELPQAIIERVIRGASAFRGRELLTLIADDLEEHAGAVVFLGHHGNRICNRTKAVVWLLAPNVKGSLQFGNMWKQNEFFLCQVLSQLFVELCELRLNHGQLNPGRTMKWYAQTTLKIVNLDPQVVSPKSRIARRPTRREST